MQKEFSTAFVKHTRNHLDGKKYADTLRNFLTGSFELSESTKEHNNLCTKETPSYSEGVSFSVIYLIIYYLFNYLFYKLFYYLFVLFIISLAATKPVAAAVTIFPALPAPSPIKYILSSLSLKLLSVSISFEKNLISGP